MVAIDLIKCVIKMIKFVLVDNNPILWNKEENR